MNASSAAWRSAGAPWAWRNQGSGGNGVAGVVDVCNAVAVDPVSAGVLGGGVDGGAAPGVPSCAADAELHRPGRPVGIGAGVHTGQVGLAVVALDGADPGEHRADVTNKRIADALGGEDEDDERG